MLVVGLTGGIGSGKTTVAKLFAEYNVPIIDADIIAREVVEPHQPAFAALVNRFGKKILNEKGELDRKKLRHIIFNDEEERKWLEELLHPLIREDIENKIKNLSSPYCIVVIPLLFETPPHSFIDRVLVVDTPEHLQLSRVMDRDKVDITHAASIIKTQIPREHRTEQADDIILNDGKMNDLSLQVKKLHDEYLRMSNQ